jgi:putative SOS response-associated peptidase YedK
MPSCAAACADVSEIKLVFGIPPERPTPNFPPSWNVAPTDSLPVVRYDAKAAQRALDMLRWGLVPYWAKDIKVGFANINAKAESIETKPAFGKAFERRRCLVPVDSFYEWRKTASGKQPYLAIRRDALPWLFVSEREQPLTRQAVNYLIATAARRAGLPPVHPHMLRHSCGFYLANRSYDLRLIQDYLGHRDPKHTAHYTRVAGSRFEGLWR